MATIILTTALLFITLAKPLLDSYCHHNASLQLQALINEQQLRFDIDYVVRTDLASFTLSGDNAFDTLVNAFKLTPGLRLSNAQLCYGAQSGEVFITAIDKNDEQHFVLSR